MIVKLKWPHMNQNPRYVTSALTFNQLTFAQFVGGEARTILKTNDSNECYGRLRILSKVSYLYEQCRSWEKARAAYFAMISSIEEGEASWNSSFGHYDMMCPAPSHEATEGRPEGRRRMSPQSKKEFYCKEFQKGDCGLQAPHRAWVKNSYEIVDHFCFQCFRNKQGKQQHSPVNEECPLKK